MNILQTKINDIRKLIKDYKSQGFTVGLVPTMGALHRGHISLIEKSKQTCDKTVVSIFVNPTQFSPNEDFGKYPRTLEQDLKICEQCGVDVVFVPSAFEMYGEEKFGDKKLSGQYLTYVTPPYQFIDALCGKTRMNHFDGVCTVVMKLFNIAQPDFAFFGLKDVQQFIIINKMVNDLSIPVKVVGCSTVRESDGLALSSRNKYLDVNSRSDALLLHKMLMVVEKAYLAGTKNTQDLFDMAIQLLNEKIELEYLDFVDYDTFEKPDTIETNTIVAVAAKVDKVRLIDNIILR